MAESTASELPFEIIFFEILPKLPLKSLGRFKTVSKSFNTVISSSHFIRHHYESTENRLVNCTGTMSTLKSFNLDSFLPAPSTAFIFPKFSFATPINACNGLVCIKCVEYFVILNPSTRSGIKVSSPCNCSHYGFGYDEGTDDYKILFTSQTYELRYTFVYSVKSELWKLVHQDTSGYGAAKKAFWRGSVLLDNHLLHFPVAGCYPECKVCCFDLCTETWKDDVPMPCWFDDPPSNRLGDRLGVLQDCLFTTLDIKDECIQVWVMKEYGVKESWTQLLSISISLYGENLPIPIAFGGTGSSELLIKECYSFAEPKLVWYDLENNSIRDAIAVAASCDWHPYVCNESLVTLPGAKPFETLYESDSSNNVI